MSRYKIWDKSEQIITPVGEVLSAEEWMERHPISKIFDIIISGGAINGSVCMEYNQTIDIHKRMGVDFSNCETQQDYLDAIEAWEDAQSKITVISDQTRIADALEDLVVMQLPDIE